MQNINVKLFVLIFLATGSGAASPYEQGLSENQARFGSVEGDVGVLLNGTASWITPSEGMPIEAGDQIRTSEEGRVELSLSQRMFVFLEPKTQVVAERAEPNGGRVNLLEGTLFGKLDSAGTVERQNWEFNTPSAVCGVRGTEFALTTTPSEGTRLGVFEGEIDVQEAERPQELAPLVRVGTMQEAWVMRGKPLRHLRQFSPSLQPMLARRSVLRARQGRMKRIWTPFTPETRLEARTRLRKGVLKERPIRKRVIKRRRPAAGEGDAF